VKPPSFTIQSNMFLPPVIPGASLC
jgi:hypothetical protein